LFLPLIWRAHRPRLTASKFCEKTRDRASVALSNGRASDALAVATTHIGRVGYRRRAQADICHYGRKGCPGIGYQFTTSKNRFFFGPVWAPVPSSASSRSHDRCSPVPRY
jgi:hypothetical protein